MCQCPLCRTRTIPDTSPSFQILEVYLRNENEQFMSECKDIFIVLSPICGRDWIVTVATRFHDFLEASDPPSHILTSGLIFIHTQRFLKVGIL